MNCPICESSNTRKFSIVYEQGTSHGKSEGFSDHSSYETEHVTQTPLAKRCSPPKTPVIGVFLGFIIFVLSVFSAFKIGGISGSYWFGFGAFILSLFIFIILWERTIGAKKRKRYDAEYEDWKNSWVCLKCGNDFRYRL